MKIETLRELKEAERRAFLELAAFIIDRSFSSECAAALGVCIPAVNHWLHVRRYPDEVNLVKLEDFCFSKGFSYSDEVFS